MIEPPCTDRYARWCERTANQLMVSFLLDLNFPLGDHNSLVFLEEILGTLGHANRYAVFILEAENYGKICKILVNYLYSDAKLLLLRPIRAERRAVFVAGSGYLGGEIGISLLREFVKYVKAKSKGHLFYALLVFKVENAGIIFKFKSEPLDTHGILIGNKGHAVDLICKGRVLSLINIGRGRRRGRCRSRRSR